MAKGKNPIMEKRMFENMYICMKCNARNKLKSLKKAKCRKCGSKALRLKRKLKKGA